MYFSKISLPPRMDVGLVVLVVDGGFGLLVGELVLAILRIFPSGISFAFLLSGLDLSWAVLLRDGGDNYGGDILCIRDVFRNFHARVRVCPILNFNCSSILNYYIFFWDTNIINIVHGSKILLPFVFLFEVTLNKTNGNLCCKSYEESLFI